MRGFSRTISIVVVAAFLMLGGFKCASAMALKTSAPRGSLATGIIGWWTMDGADSTATTLTDKSASNVTLTKYGATPATGKIGQGIVCNGTSDYALSGSTASGSSGYITAAAWIKYRGTWNNPIAVDRSTDWRILSGSESSAVASAMFSSSADPWGTRVSGTTVLSPNTWYHIAFTFDGANAKIWVNGVLDGTRPSTGTLNINTTNTSFCTYNSHNSNFLNGWIDDVRVYNRALSPSEIKQLYSMGGGAKVATPQKQSQFQNKGINTGLVGWWTMDGADVSGTTIYDKSNTGNTGTKSATLLPTSGKLGQALGSFTGGNYINVGNSSSLNPSIITITAWIKIITPAVANNNIAVRGNADYIFETTNSGGDVEKLIFYFNGYNAYYGNSNVPKNTWNFVAVSYNPNLAGDNIKFYLNGGADGTSATTSPMSSTANSNLIGARGGNTSNFYLDDVRIYNRALSPSEIKQLYSMGGGAKLATPQTQSQFQNKGINSGLVGWWTFDGADVTATDVLDKSGSGNTGTRTAVTPVAGKIGQAFNFNGSSSKIEIADTSSQITAAAGTISVWAKAPQVPTVAGPPMVYFSGLKPYFYFETDGFIYLYWSGATGMPGGGPYSNPVTGFTLNTWHHMVATWNGDTYKVYMDGILRDSGSGCTFAATTGGIETLGASGSVFWNGQLDDVRVFNRALSLAEVKQLYNMGK